jgi:hypothetical protein
MGHRLIARPLPSLDEAAKRSQTLFYIPTWNNINLFTYASHRKFMDTAHKDGTN